jgi:hypothetical protein
MDAVVPSPLPTGVDEGATQAPPIQTTPSPVIPTVDTRCIIQIRSARYDLTEFRSRHSGGNIFTCNSDMTAVFYSQHTDQMLAQLEQYKIQ